ERRSEWRGSSAVAVLPRRGSASDDAGHAAQSGAGGMAGPARVPQPRDGFARLAFDAEELEIGRAIDAGREIVAEIAIGDFDDVVGDELGPFARRLFRMLQRIFPFVDRPAGEVIGRQLGKDGLKVDLTVAERAVAPGALDPTLVAAIHTLLRRRIELGVLDVEHLDSVVIEVDEAEIVHALLDVVAGVVIDVAALVAADRIQEHIERLAVEDVFERMDLKAKIDAILVMDVEDRLPAARLFGEAILDETSRSLR